MAVTFTAVDKECHLPHQQTEDAAAIKPSATAATGLVSPWGYLGWRQRSCLPSSQASQPLQSPSTVQLEGIHVGKELDTGPRYWGAYQRNSLIKPTLLHLAIHINRKALNSLTWDVCFLFNLLMFWLPVFVAKTPIHPGSSSTSLEQPLSYLRGCLPGVHPQNVHW